MYRESRIGGGDRFFNSKQHILHDDGLLTIKASGWEDGETHWTGFMTVSPSEPDYDFWYWMACIKQVPELVQERELDKWKGEYAASRKGMAGVVPVS